MGNLGDRMKMYESVSDYRLIRRMPVVVRLDGKAFHSFTKGFIKPFDTIFINSMQDTLKKLCENVQGCVFGYCQSDEISLVLCDYQTYDTEAWFDYRIEKMCSVGASMASRFFNQAFKGNTEAAFPVMGVDSTSFGDWDKYRRKFNNADFDCRVFNVPKEEVVNAILWRQRDCERNSILFLAQSMYSQKEIQGINTKDLQDKMFEEKGVNWNELPTVLKRGTACIKKHLLEPTNLPGLYIETERKEWVLDKEMPILSQDREYLEKLIRFEE